MVVVISTEGVKLRGNGIAFLYGTTVFGLPLGIEANALVARTSGTFIFMLSGSVSVVVAIAELRPALPRGPGHPLEVPPAPRVAAVLTN
jgi:hypothetical protein